MEEFENGYQNLVQGSEGEEKLNKPTYLSN